MGTNAEDAHRLWAAEKGYGFGRVVWSPDGRRLAYFKVNRDEVTIESRDLKGGQTTVIVSDPRLKDFCWAPDGRIIFSRLENPREATANIWEIRTDPSTAHASGEPRRLTEWAGFTMFDLSASADGKRVAFVRKSDQSDVYLGQLEANGSRMSSPLRLTLDDRMDWPGGWLRDSKAVLFFSDRNGTFDIFKQRIKDRRAEEVIAGPAEEKRNPQLSPDSNWILYLAWPKGGSGLLPHSGRLMRVPVSGGPPEFVFDVKGYPGSAQVPRERWLPTARGYPDFRCPIARGAPCILSETSPERIVFSAFDPLEGKKTEVTRLDANAGDTFWDLSPDSSRIAFGKFDDHNGKIRVVDLADGTTHEVLVKGWTHLDSVGWAADGKSLFVTNWASEGGAVLRVALSGEAQLLRREVGMEVERPVPSPDGHYLAYGEVTTAGNAWMIENF